MPTVQGTDDFNHAIDSGYYADGFFSSGGSPDAVTSPLYASEAKSLRIVSDGNNIGARHNISGTPSFGWAGFAFRTTSLPAGSLFICSFGTAAGVVPALALDSTGIFATIGGDVGVPTAISPNTWYWVECIADLGSGTRRMRFRVGGVDGDTSEVVGGATTVSWHQMISFAGDPSGNTSYRGSWRWGSAANASDWLGEPVVAGSGAGLHIRRQG